ncbi:threonine/homoserine efflux transporter RhtA [Gemmobacter caeni]|uniref:Threonine/homoserine efflux transporter RhtA n=2 Tax=Gemmobacter caeni TaxID=589035 RepID=A0A2T6B4Z5_9RHOB|nr:threonine/homoserine efflux transporter RhtA [Gemmobacter caeni]TWJ01151.1 threonine/homoserine efflux transporter RhtA [Gemmobacter caeni]
MKPVEGVMWMLASGLSFVGVTGLVRWLGTDLPAAQGAFLRFAFGVMFLLPTLGPVLRGGFAPGAMRLFALRGAVHTVAVICWFYAMARLPVAEVTAIGYLNPVLVTVGAAVFLGEKLAMRRILAVCVAILGALVILRPGMREVTDGHLAQVAAAFGFAGSYLVAKRLSGMASAGAVVAMMSLMVTLGLAPFALAVWVPVTPVQLVALAGVAAFATSGHYCMTRAFAVAPLTVTQPVTFLQLLWATLLGYVVFHETVDIWVLAGGGVIIAAISYITWREAMLNRRSVTPSVLATKS